MGGTSEAQTEHQCNEAKDALDDGKHVDLDDGVCRHADARRLNRSHHPPPQRHHQLRAESSNVRSRLAATSAGLSAQIRTVESQGTRLTGMPAKQGAKTTKATHRTCQGAAGTCNGNHLYTRSERRCQGTRREHCGHDVPGRRRSAHCAACRAGAPPRALTTYAPKQTAAGATPRGPPPA